MTIEEHIEVLKSYNHGFTGYAGNLQDSIYVAMDIMCKYQKIEEIMHKVYTSDNADVCLVQRLAEIREVLEDGNDDC